MNTRRKAIKTMVGSAALFSLAGAASKSVAAADNAAFLKGAINHSVCKWCYKGMPLDAFCETIKEIGIKSVELLGPKDFPTLKKHGLTNAMVMHLEQGMTIDNAFNKVENHDILEKRNQYRGKYTFKL